LDGATASGTGIAVGAESLPYLSRKLASSGSGSEICDAGDAGRDAGPARTSATVWPAVTGSVQGAPSQTRSCATHWQSVPRNPQTFSQS
jgi:hypothetical protein